MLNLTMRLTKLHRLLGLAYALVALSFAMRPDAGGWLAVGAIGGAVLQAMIFVALLYSAAYLMLSSQVKAGAIAFASLPFCVFHLIAFARAISLPDVPINANSVYIGLWLLPLLTRGDMHRAYRALSSIIVITGVLIFLRPFGVVELIEDVFRIAPSASASLMILSGLLLLIFRSHNSIRFMFVIAPFIYLVVFTGLYVLTLPSVPITLATIFVMFLIMIVRFAYDIERLNLNDSIITSAADS